LPEEVLTPEEVEELLRELNERFGEVSSSYQQINKY